MNADRRISPKEMQRWIMQKTAEHFQEAVEESRAHFRAVDPDGDGTAPRLTERPRPGWRDPSLVLPPCFAGPRGPMALAAHLELPCGLLHSSPEHGVFTDTSWKEVKYLFTDGH